MAKDTFDALSAARSLRTARLEDEQAAAIVGAIRLAVSDLVTVQRFKAGLAELRAHTDTQVAVSRADNRRVHLALAGVIIGANALMLTVAGYVLAAVLGA